MAVRSSVPESRATSFTSKAYAVIGYQIALSIAHACLEFVIAKGPLENNAPTVFHVCQVDFTTRAHGWLAQRAQGFLR